MKGLNKVRTVLLSAAVVYHIASTAFSLLSIFTHVDLDFEIVFCFIFGAVLCILGFIYPIIHKAEMMIKKMDEEEDKKSK